GRLEHVDGVAGVARELERRVAPGPAADPTRPDAQRGRAPGPADGNPDQELAPAGLVGPDLAGHEAAEADRLADRAEDAGVIAGTGQDLADERDGPPGQRQAPGPGPHPGETEPGRGHGEARPDHTTAGPARR